MHPLKFTVVTLSLFLAFSAQGKTANLDSLNNGPKLDKGNIGKAVMVLAARGNPLGRKDLPVHLDDTEEETVAATPSHATGKAARKNRFKTRSIEKNTKTAIDVVSGGKMKRGNKENLSKTKKNTEHEVVSK